MEYASVRFNTELDRYVVTKLYNEFPILYKGTNTNPANQLTENELSLVNIYPVDDNIPTYDIFISVLKEKNIDEWSFDSDSDVVLKEYSISTISFEEKKQSMIKELATIRYAHEIEGVNGPGGMIATDRSSQAMLNSVLQVMRDEPSKIIKWKCEDSWIELDSTSVEQISTLVVSHVESCFDNEFVLWTSIGNATNIDDLKLIDLNSGWPD